MVEDNKNNDDFGEDLTDFGVPMDFQMPDFSGIGRTMKLMSWLPAMLSSVVVFFLSFLALVIYNGWVQYGYNLTYDAFMWMIIVPLIAALTTLILVKVNTGRQMKNSMPFAL